MKRILFCILLLTTCHFVQAQDRDVATIRALLNAQTVEWNNGNMEGFMSAYWNSDSLVFIGQRGITYGYQNTLNNYKKNYPTKLTRGQLNFDIYAVQRVAADIYFVAGKWMLTRPALGDLQGQFSLIWKKIEGEWKIVADYSS